MNLTLTNPAAEDYAASFSSAEDELLKEVADFTRKTHPKSHMLSGPVQGQLLTMLSKIIRPSRILEIGTFTGYSALCLAEGLTEDGLLYTIELREEDGAKAQSFFNKSKVKDLINLHIGNALEIIPALDERWDIVFLDADKVNYIRYYEMVMAQLRTGGIIIADNVLFHGRVLEDPVTNKNAMAIQAFNEHIKQDSRVDQVLLTVRDGLMLIMKK
ncbi:MAG: class I SAM-dependent methyltransferase [Chitinophagaceae bacterium]|nr:class I SAM-dependent methyltransferase [Chitinophagaceae bacterium]